MFRCFIVLRSLMSPHGAQHGPTWAPRGPQKRPKSAFEIGGGSPFFGFDVGNPGKTDLGAIWGPSWGSLGPTWGHLGPSWGHLGAILGHLGPSWGHLGAILGRLGAIFGPCWAILGHIGPSWGHLGTSLGDLGAILDHLAAILGPSRGHLGPSWGHLGFIFAVNLSIQVAFLNCQAFLK